MDLSQPHIAIRERSLLEIFDLTLHVYRDHFRNILILLAINAFPFFVIDTALALWIGYDESEGTLALLTMLMLVLNQFQMGTLLITQYLGTATFSGKPSIGGTVKAFWGTSLNWIWSHGFVRMVFPVMGVLLIGGVWWAILLTLVGLMPRALRPFISEILILEQPDSKKAAADLGTISLTQRNSDLHRGDVLGGFLLATCIGGCLLVTIVSLFFHLDTAIGLNGSWDLAIHYAYWPLAAWLTASVLATFRFLYYINTRITQEGWEVTLKLMAEKQKLTAKDDY